MKWFQLFIVAILLSFLLFFKDAQSQTCATGPFNNVTSCSSPCATCLQVNYSCTYQSCDSLANHCVLDMIGAGYTSALVTADCTMISCLNCAPCSGGNWRDTCTCSVPQYPMPNTCLSCVSGFYGSHCTACPNCGTHGTCNQGIAGNGTCSCSTGWNGSLCTTCAVAPSVLPV
jgi:hypothetical protein